MTENFKQPFLNNLTRRKPYYINTSLETKLNRCLKSYQLLLYVIAQSIGAGIFIFVGHLAKDRAGPAVNLSFLLGGISTIFTAMIYCEFSTLIPKAGSIYVYTYIVIGELPAFFVGWTVLGDLLSSASAVVKGFSGTLNLLTGNAINNFTRTYLEFIPKSEIFEESIDILSVVVILLLLMISISGTTLSFNVNAVITCIIVLILLVISIGCFIYGKPSNYLAGGSYMPYGFLGVLESTGLTIFAYSGYDTLANSAEETENPKKSIPIALFGSLSIITFLYVLASTALPFLVPYMEINVNSPFVSAFERVGAYEFKWLSGIATLFATSITKVTYFYVMSRVLYAMSSDGLLFKFLGYIEPRTQIPIFSMILGGVIIMISASIIKIQVLGDLVSIGILFAGFCISINILLFRYLFNFEINDFDNLKSVDLRLNNLPKFVSSQRSFKIVLFGFVLSVFISSFILRLIISFNFTVGIVFAVIFAVIALVIFSVLSVYQPKYPNVVFSTPLMPLTPCISIVLNVIMLVNMPYPTWIRFIVWTLFGLLIYVSYGYWNSIERTDELPENCCYRTRKDSEEHTTTPETTLENEKMKLIDKM